VLLLSLLSLLLSLFVDNGSFAPPSLFRGVLKAELKGVESSEEEEAVTHRNMCLVVEKADIRR